MDLANELFARRFDLLDHGYNESEVVDSLREYLARNNPTYTDQDIDDTLRTFYMTYDIEYDERIFDRSHRQIIDQSNIYYAVQNLRNYFLTMNSRAQHIRNTMMLINRLIPNNMGNMEDVKVTLDENDLKEISTKKLENKLDKDCCICLGALDKDEEVSTLKCSHHFHKDCIATYFKEYNYLCPLCKAPAGKAKAHVDEDQSNSQIDPNSEQLPDQIPDFEIVFMAPR
jgi:hypothetical protein